MDDKDYTIDLMEVAEIIKENRKPIARMTGCVIALSIVYLIIALLFFPKYESEATLQIKQQSKGGGMLAALAGFSGTDFIGMGSMQMGTYKEIIKSRGVVVPVIEATEEKKGEKYPEYESYVKKRISVEEIKLTDILKVKANAETAEKAQKVNQLLLENFLKRMAELNSDEKGSMKQFLTDRVKAAQEELNKAETALEKFKAENRIISPTANADIFANRIIEVEKQAAINQVEMEAAQAKLTAINSQLSGSGATSADNKTIQQYNSELAKLEAERISYVDKYTEKHPKMIEVNDRIAKLKSKVQEEINKVAALQAPSDNEVHQALVTGKYQSEGEVTVTRQKAAALQQVIDQNNAELAKLPALEREYITLERDFKVANEIYLMLTKKLEETKITEHQNPDNVLIVDAPTLPDSRSSPALKLSLVGAAILGLLLSCSYVVVKELMHKSIRGVEDVRFFLELPVLGLLPDEVVTAKVSATIQESKEPSWCDKLKEFIWKD